MVIRLLSKPSISAVRYSSRFAYKSKSFHTSAIRRQQQQQQQKPLLGRLIDSWNNTETKWYPIPVALGLGVIGFIQYRRVIQREEDRLEHPKKYVASGPWQVMR